MGERRGPLLIGGETRPTNGVAQQIGRNAKIRSQLPRFIERFLPPIMFHMQIDQLTTQSDRIRPRR